MRAFSSAPVRRAVAALALAACVVGLTAGSASATDRLPETSTSAVVAKLAITDGHGWLTVQVRVGSGRIRGFGVRVPQSSAPGSWGGRADVYAPDMDVRCRRQPGPDLHYLCGSTDYPDSGAAALPMGTFQVTIPVTYTGTVERRPCPFLYCAPWGSAWVIADNDHGTTSDYGTDDFPVFAGSHFRSTAEVRTARITENPGRVEQRATIPITMTIVPREPIPQLWMPLPDGEWWIVGTNASSHGVRCKMEENIAPSLLSCSATPSVGGGLPVGRYNLVLTLGFRPSPHPDQPGSPSVPGLLGLDERVASGHRSYPALMDTFGWGPAVALTENTP